MGSPQIRWKKSVKKRGSSNENDLRTIFYYFMRREEIRKQRMKERKGICDPSK